MNRFVLSLIFFVTLEGVASQATPSINAGSSAPKGLNDLTANPNQTPYEKIEALFNSAAPMQISQFPTPKSPDLNKWHCTTAGKDTKAEDLSVNNIVPVVLVGKIVISPEVPANGPLFPGTPEKDQSILTIGLISNDGSFNETPENIGKDYQNEKTSLQTYPGVSQHSLVDSNDPKSELIVTYRTVNQMIVISQVFVDPSYASKHPEYSNYTYCWQQ